MKKKNFLWVVMFFIASQVFGQQTNFYLDLSATYSFIPDVERQQLKLVPPNMGIISSAKITESYKVKSGVYLGAGIEKSYVKNLFVNAGLGLSFYQYQKNIKADVLPSPVAYLLMNSKFAQPIAKLSALLSKTPLKDVNFKNQNDNMGDTKMLYLTLPVRLKYAVIPHRFKVGLGLTNYFLVYSEQMKRTFKYENNTLTFLDDKDTSGNAFNTYQLGGNVSLEYRVYKKLWVQGNYNHGFVNIYKDSDSNSKFRTIELGLKLDL